MGDLTIDATRDGTVGVIRLKGEARLELIDTLRNEARRLAAAGAKHLLLVLVDVAFIDSASIGVVIELQKEIEGKGGTLVLVGITPRFRRMIEGMGLLGRFRTAPDEAAARKLLPSP